MTTQLQMTPAVLQQPTSWRKAETAAPDVFYSSVLVGGPEPEDYWTGALDWRRFADAPYVGYAGVVSPHTNLLYHNTLLLAAETPKPPCRVESDGTVVLNYGSMEEGRPYPFQVGGFWFIGVRPAGAREANIYYVPNE